MTRSLPGVRSGLGDGELVALFADADFDGVAVDDLAFQELPGERVADGGLDEAAERAGAVDRVEAAVGEPRFGGVADGELEAAGLHAVLEEPQLDFDDRLQVVVLERVE
ncbi:hypothetical protein ADL26_18000, partial [Thermoactinomyces vulgaris]